jgi:DNA-3-methyladenine glycosylase II
VIAPSELTPIAQPETLTAEGLISGLEVLAARDCDLASILHNLGPPPLWEREASFATLIHIILEQQVSLASARATFDRLQSTIPVTPEQFLTLDDLVLKQMGFSRQKTRYGRLLAEAIATQQLDLDTLTLISDQEVRTTLTQIKGIGNWTVDIYLLMALKRPDVFPKGDLALALAVQKVKRLDHRPQPEELIAIAQPWQPWRSIATHLLWHDYLSDRAVRSRSKIQN